MIWFQMIVSFVYATALSGVIDPCYKVPDIEYCIEVHSMNIEKKGVPYKLGDILVGL